MKIGRESAILALAIALSGCAVSGPIQRVDQSDSAFKDAVYSGEIRMIVNATELGKYPPTEQYRVFQQCATGAGSVPEARDWATPRMVEFCRALNKEPEVLKEHVSVPPYILGNFPRIEMTFVCVDKLKFENNANNLGNGYSKILELKSLLDKNAITQQEYDIEKSKILKKSGY